MNTETREDRRAAAKATYELEQSRDWSQFDAYADEFRDTPLAKIAKFNYGHLTSFGLATEWRSIRFTESGVSRFARICGWLWGLAMAGKAKEANHLAGEILEQLAYLDGYGGDIDMDTTFQSRFADRKVPQYQIELSDDGTFNGFSICWYLAVPMGTQREGMRFNDSFDKELTRYDPAYQTALVKYAYAFNGGLLYHGPGGGEVFAINLGSRPWGIHT